MGQTAVATRTLIQLAALQATGHAHASSIDIVSCPTAYLLTGHRVGGELTQDSINNSDTRMGRHLTNCAPCHDDTFRGYGQIQGIGKEVTTFRTRCVVNNAHREQRDLDEVPRNHAEPTQLAPTGWPQACPCLLASRKILQRSGPPQEARELSSYI